MNDFPRDHEIEYLRYYQAAQSVQTTLLRYFSERNDIYFEDRKDAPAICYSLRSRIKAKSRIFEKLLQRIEEGKSYNISMMRDICGFRIVTLYQDQIPYVVSKLLNEMCDRQSLCMILDQDQIIDIDVKTPRNGTSSYGLIEQVVSEAKKKNENLNVNLKESISETGYSAIHVEPWALVPFRDAEIKSMKIEIQIRSAFEDIWAEIDHKIDYELRRGRESIPRNRHLTILKGFVDNVIAYAAEIKRSLNESKNEKEVKSTNSLNRPSSQLQLLRAKAISEDIVELVKRAFDECKEIYAREIFRRDIGAKAFRAGVAAFEQALTAVRNLDANLTAEQKMLVSYVCEMEMAFLLLYTNETGDRERAEEIYLSVIERGGDDATAYYRLGEIHRSRKNYKQSVEYLEKALKMVRENRLEATTKEVWFLDSLRKSLALSRWRVATAQSKTSEEKGFNIKGSIDIIYENIESPSDRENKNLRGRTLNDLLYYCWEAEKIDKDLIPEKLNYDLRHAMASELMQLYEKGDAEEDKALWLDTLLRVYENDVSLASKLAIELEGLLAQEVTKVERDGISLWDLDWASPRWNAFMLRALDEDRADAFIFAQEIIIRYNVERKNLDPCGAATA